MPFTPFHFGPGLALHAAAPRRIDLASFCAANVLTDVEPLYRMLAGVHPAHGFFHGFLGATLTAAATAAAFLAARARWPDLFRWQAPGPWPVVLGALLGTWSHVLLDGYMHGNVHPFTPFSDARPFFHRGSGGAVEAVCVAAAVLGALMLALRRHLETRRAR